MAARRRLKAPLLRTFLRTTLTGGTSEVAAILLGFVKKADSEMETDESLPAAADTDAPSSHATKSTLPEVEAMAYLLVIVFLIDNKLLNEAKECSIAAVNRLQTFNRRTLDWVASRIYFYYSLAHERTNSLPEIRSTLLALSRTAALRHDAVGQETLLNLLLRNYLSSNLYDQAEKLRSKTQRPDSHSNHQFCRYLYYLGRIRAIQLEYSDAKDCLQQALRKAPMSLALGFRTECSKWAVLVRLLLGEIPERTTFVASGMRASLLPYFQLTNAVRVGDLGQFHSVADKFADIFRRDHTHNLIVRLRHNVIRAGLRRISLSYSRISLADIADRLKLGSGATAVQDAEGIVTKAIRDGGIDAAVKHAEGWLESKESGDMYSSTEPQAAFHSRIAFCLNTHNEAVQAMRFPPDAHKQGLESGEQRRERQQQEQVLAQHIAEEDDEF
eukprot:TRINITY_DN3070_c0_g2_i1.p1 TRINITY_DN3070_c0_g2~~TRINITY_DN3070_c0_g2_i1.p1  ORF type:complete len:479 (-),score=134.79 TRINITY_DN3070_c0_g2_i1:244-1572(-)